MVSDQLPPPPASLPQRWNKWLDDNRVSARFECWYPLILGLLTFVVARRAAVTNTQFDGLMKDVAPVAISVAAIFAGFQGAILAIILGMANSRAIKNLRKADKFEALMDYLRSGTGTLVCFVAIAMVVVGLRAVDVWTNHLSGTFAILSAIFIWSLGSSVRIVSIMFKLIRSVASET